jgi:hypothetical protein
VLLLAEFLGNTEIVLEYHSKDHAQWLNAHHMHVVHIQCEAALDCVAMMYDAMMHMHVAKQLMHDLSVRDKEDLKCILCKVRQNVFVTAISTIPSSSTNTKRGHNSFAAAPALKQCTTGSGQVCVPRGNCFWCRHGGYMPGVMIVLRDSGTPDH